MADSILTHFEPDPDLLAVISECMENYDVGDPDTEWPNNIISRRAVVYGSGVIGQQGVPIRHTVSSDELALCHRLVAEVIDQVGEMDVGMGSESSDPFRGFFIAGDSKSVATGISDFLIRSRFGGTLFPGVMITVEPLAERGIWWAEVEADGFGSEEEYFAPWRAMIQWFRQCPDFVDAAFVRVGDQDLQSIPEEQWPTGTKLIGCVFPRLALGLTHGGSLVGLFGYCVKT